MRLLLSLSLLLLCSSAFAQGKKKDDDLEPVKVIKLDRKDPVSYDKDVEPMFYKRCVTCHSGSVKEGKLDLSAYDALVKGGKRGQAIVAGKSGDSLLVKMAGRTQKPHMPPKGEGDPITPEELALLKMWIDQGAKAPSGQRAKAKIVVTNLPPMVTPVRALALSPDKSTVAAGRGGRIDVYDAGSGTHIRALVDPNLKTGDGKPVNAAHLSIVDSMAFSPDGKYLASGSFLEVTLWDAKTGVILHKIPGFAHMVVALAFSPDSKLLVTGGGAPAEDGEIKIYETGSWKLVNEIKAGHSDTVYGVSISPDNKLVATCSADKFIKVWEIPAGKFVKSFEGHTHHVLDIGWNAEGKLLASAGADNTVKIWDYEKGEQLRTINNAHTKQVTRLVFIGKTGNFATCSGDATVKFFNTGGGNVRSFPSVGDFIYAVSVSPDGNVVAAGGQEGVVRIYNGANGQLVRSLLPPGVEQKK